jgi:GNAT superfamily N-acetyltransferase
MRAATPDDLGLLWEFLAIAAYEPDVDAAKAVPFVAAHLAGWRRPEDFGFIAELEAAAIGAAWARQFSPGEQPAFYVDEQTPEITIGVKRHSRGRGVGQMLLDALTAEAARRWSVPECPARQSGATSLRAQWLSPRVGVRRAKPGRRHVIGNDLGRASVTAR